MRIPTVVLLSLLVIAPGTSSAAAPCPSLQWTPGHETVTGIVWNVVTLDYNGDGKLDLAAIVERDRDELVTFKGLGNGTFEEPVTLFVADSDIRGAISDIEAADVTGDGLTDLVAGYNNKLRVYRATGTGLATPADQTLSYSWPRLTFGNFDGDSAVELLTVATGYKMFVVYDNSFGTFTETRRVTGITGWPLDGVSADFDGDGRFDVAITNRMPDDTGTVDVHFRNSDGTFAAPVILAGGSYPGELELADFDGNGRPDLATSNWNDNTVQVFNNGGSRQFTSATIDVNYPDGFGNAHPLLARDVNGDGHADLVSGSVNGGPLTTLLGVGDGTFRSPNHWLLKRGNYISFFDSITSGDYDADGDIDLAMGVDSALLVASPSCTTQVILTTEAALISSGTDAVLHISIAGFGSPTPQPYGTVTLKKGATTIGTATPGGNGKATIIAPALTAGDHTFTAEFSGNAEIAAATSNSATQKVTNNTTQTTISVTTTQPAYGDSLPVTVQVLGSGSGDEWYSLYVDGVATTRYTSVPAQLKLPVGQHSIYARFLGTNWRPASTSPTLTINVQKRNPAMALSSGATTVRVGQVHALQFSVTGPGGSAQPTGNLQLFSGSTLLGTGTIANGLAGVSTTLARGAHQVRAVYSGDGNYNTFTHNLTLNVVANQTLAIDARGLTSAIHIAYVVPDGASSMALFRRLAGSNVWEPSGWDPVTGLDSAGLQRGVAYEYQLRATISGVTHNSNIDGALLFTGDPLSAGHTVKRAHFTELRDAVNLLRAAGGLAPFAFSSTFNDSPVIRAEHLVSLRNAAAEARAALGMTAVTFSDTIAAGTIIRAAPIRELQDAIR